MRTLPAARLFKQNDDVRQPIGSNICPSFLWEINRNVHIVNTQLTLK